ncbi:helix-turn-helix transcriptional regulator [Sinorhizobium fredii]|uniref:helix-turn-helix domain-containing protein n=1 Tax=Rhizobium fredii TaxID=380 RepID=UPI0030A42DB5
MPQVVEFDSAKRQKQVLAKGNIREYNFRDIHELTAFLAGEIHASKLNYTKLADRGGVCPTTVSHIANGVTQSPRCATVLQLLKALGFDVFVRG